MDDATDTGMEDTTEPEVDPDPEIDDATEEVIDDGIDTGMDDTTEPETETDADRTRNRCGSRDRRRDTQR